MRCCYQASGVLEYAVCKKTHDEQQLHEYFGDSVSKVQRGSFGNSPKGLRGLRKPPRGCRGAFGRLSEASGGGFRRPPAAFESVLGFGASGRDFGGLRECFRNSSIHFPGLLGPRKRPACWTAPPSFQPAMSLLYVCIRFYVVARFHST